MKKLLLLFSVILLVGCADVKVDSDSTIQKEKEDYLALKNNLDTYTDYDKEEELPCNITFSLDKTSDEELSYRVILDNPKIDMYNIKALLIHDYFTEDIFPSIGIFDEPQSLIVGNDEIKGFELVGYIETSKDIDINLKLYLEYTDKNGNINDIYYKYNPSEDVNI